MSVGPLQCPSCDSNQGNNHLQRCPCFVRQISPMQVKILCRSWSRKSDSSPATGCILEHSQVYENGPIYLGLEMQWWMGCIVLCISSCIYGLFEQHIWTHGLEWLSNSIQESIRTVAMEQNVNLKLNNMLPIDDVAREAFAVLVHADIIKTPADIKFSEVPGPLQFINQFGNEGQQVLVFDCDCI